MRGLTIFASYALAGLALYAGCEFAPAHGWPQNDVELNGCVLLALGLLSKTIGHAALIFWKEA